MVAIHHTCTMKIISILIDSILPPRESELLVRSITAETMRRLYRKENAHGCLCLSEYRNPHVHALITENKFHHNRHASALLATLIDEFIPTCPGHIIFVPVPLGKKREKERGYNQVNTVLNHIQTSQRVSIHTQLCKRTKETVPQLTLKRDSRLQNIVGAFQVDPSQLTGLRDVTIVLVDDVCTTGATLGALQKEITQHLHTSCKVLCLALSH